MCARPANQLEEAIAVPDGAASSLLQAPAAALGDALAAQTVPPNEAGWLPESARRAWDMLIGAACAIYDVARMRRAARIEGIIRKGLSGMH